jgi:hypothetical protein
VRINPKEIEWKRLALSVSRWGPVEDSFDIATNIQVFLTYGEYWSAPVCTDSVFAVYRGPKKKLKIEVVNGS